MLKTSCLIGIIMSHDYRISNMNIYKIIMSHPIGAEPWKSQPRQTKVGKPRQETQKKNTVISIFGWKKMEKWTTWFPELYLVFMSLNFGPVLVKVITLGFQQCLQSYPAWSTLRKSELERSTHFIWVNPV